MEEHSSLRYFQNVIRLHLMHTLIGQSQDPSQVHMSYGQHILDVDRRENEVISILTTFQWTCNIV